MVPFLSASHGVYPLSWENYLFRRGGRHETRLLPVEGADGHAAGQHLLVQVEREHGDKHREGVGASVLAEIESWNVRRGRKQVIM